jgi:Protein of unknown function (DUF1559)
MLSVALVNYAEEHGGLPPAYTTNGTGKPMHSWRVLLLPYLGQESLYSQIDLNEPWDSPANRRLLEQMPEYYRSPLEAETHGTATNYFAVVGSHAPWWSAEHSKPWNTANDDEILLIEVVGSKTPWMEPRDPTIEELLDMLCPESGNSAGVSRPADIMFATTSGAVYRYVNSDRESLRKLLLGGRN